MKKYIAIILCVLLAGCAYPSKIAELEQKVARLEQAADIPDEMKMAEGVGADDKFRIWPFSGLTGGSSTNLDGIASEGAGTIAQDEDLAIGKDTSGYLYHFYYEDSDTSSESSPNVIVPDDDADSTGRWLIIARSYSDAFYSAASDGEHFADFSNSGAASHTNTDGYVSARRDRDFAYYEDGTYVIPFQNILEYDATVGTLNAKYCYGTTIFFTGSANDTLTLPAVERGMRFRIVGMSAVQLRVDPNGTEEIFLYGTGCGAGDYIYTDGTVGPTVVLEYKASGDWYAGEGSHADWSCQ